VWKNAAGQEHELRLDQHSLGAPRATRPAQEKRLTNAKMRFGPYFLGVSIAPSADKIYSRSQILHLSKPRYFSDFDVSPFIAFSSQYPLSEFTDSGNVVLAAAKIEERKPGGFSSREELKLGEFSAVYGYGLFLVDVNNETVTEIVHLPSYLDSPAIFHDQQRVLFVRNDSVWGGEAGRELWSVNLDGSNLHRIDLALMKEFD